MKKEDAITLRLVAHREASVCHWKIIVAPRGRTGSTFRKLD
jgi:hypothetical protein